MKTIFAITALLLTAFPTSAQTDSCHRDEGCCINGVQFRADFFPMCSAARKIDCIPPGRGFLRAAAACKAKFDQGSQKFTIHREPKP